MFTIKKENVAITIVSFQGCFTNDVNEAVLFSRHQLFTHQFHRIRNALIYRCYTTVGVQLNVKNAVKFFMHKHISE